MEHVDNVKPALGGHDKQTEEDAEHGPALGGTTGPREGICKLFKRCKLLLELAACSCGVLLRLHAASKRDGIKTESGAEIETSVLSFTFSFFVELRARP